jgi:hypothetical protein
MNGQTVATYYDSIVLSGTITTTFNASALPAGIYLASMMKNNQNYIQKMVKTGSLTSISEFETNETPIQVFPNPSADFITIATDLKIEGLEVYSLDGKLTQIPTVENNKINLQNLVNGNYLLHIKAENKTFIKKVSLMK